MHSKDREFYLGNTNLPTAKASFDYGAHPEWVIDIEKCKKNLLYFAECFFYIVSLDEGKQKINLRPYQKRILRALRDNRFTIVLASRQAGKALDLDTPVLTTKGWKTIGDLNPGDYVYGINGKPTKVLNTWDILFDRNCYNIEFDNGENIIADEEHLWVTQTRTERSKKIQNSIKTTKQILNTLTYGQKRKEPNHRISTCINGIAGEYQNLPIDPYVLGLWLGDSTSTSSSITVDVTSLISHLKENNLIGNKHIPNQYLLANREQRLALLQGLMDSDGYIDNNGGAYFYNTNLRLFKQTQELIQSLGYKVKTYIPKLNNVECQESSTLCFKPIEYVCRLPFKRNRIKIKQQNSSRLRAQWHYIKNITPVETRPVKCITVAAPDGIYLAGKQLIPTHNTTLMMVFALWQACFFDDQTILIAANKEDTAIGIFKRVRIAYEQLPNWLKPGVLSYGKTSMELGNGSRIGISTTSSDTARGSSCNCLILDELAAVPAEITKEYWASVYPIISASKKSKIFIASCVVGSTYIYTPQGIQQIKDFIPSDIIEGMGQEVKPYQILGKDKVNTGKIVVNSGLCKTRKIKTASTYLECSYPHKLWACKNGIYNWYKSEELNIGDWVSIQYGMELWGNNDNTSDFKPTSTAKHKNIFKPKCITPDIAYFLGLYISEGSAFKKLINNSYNGRVTISCGDSCIIDHLKKLGIPVSKPENSVGHYMCSVDLVEFLEYLGFDINLKAPKKNIPKRLMQMSRNNIIALLQGIFDGDGYCSQDIGRVGLASTSEVLIDQVRIILNNFGILSNKYFTVTPPNSLVSVSSPGFRIECSSYMSSLFLDKIKFRIKRKNFCHKFSKKYYNTKDVIPYTKKFIFNELKQFRGNLTNIKKTNSVCKFYIPKLKHVSRQFAIDLKNNQNITLSSSLSMFLDENVNQNIKWEQIINIDETENIVYDFSLDNIADDKWCHSVIYNGIIGHQTPNGTGNLFYELWDGAVKKTNNWHPERVDWWDIPGRDEKWKEETIRSMGSREMFDVEFGNTFLNEGESSLDEEALIRFQKNVKSPIHLLEEGAYKIWKMPDANHIYTIGVDVGEGVGAAATVAQIFDITDLKNIEQVACYTSNKITPIKFIPKLYEILLHWGKPPVLIERNNCGAQVVDQLKETYHYENIVNFGLNSFNRIGVQAHTNTKYRGVINQRYWVNELKQVLINDTDTVDEMHTFQRQQNGTWSARAGSQDDRVMSLIWALMILDEEICQKYFEITQKDSNNKPSFIKILDYGSPRIFQELNNSIKSSREDNSDILPVFIRPNVIGAENSDLAELESLGWKTPNY